MRRFRAVDAGATWRRAIGGGVGGQAFLGFIAAVAFATILAVAPLDAGWSRRRCRTTSYGACVPSWSCHRTRANVVASRFDDPARRRGDRARHRLQGQNVPIGRSRLARSPPAANFPAWCLSMFGSRSPPVVRRRRFCSHSVDTAADLDVAPSRWISLAIPPRCSLSHPGLFTIPLSFAVGIIVSLLTPEPNAASNSPARQQIHFGELNDRKRLAQ